jgi:ABC-type multidrug transport system fused ATPase/permease subunit
MSKDREQHIFNWLDLLRAQLYFLRENRRKYVFWVVVIFIAFFYFLVPPFIVGTIVDFFTQYRKGESLYKFYYYIVVLGVSMGIVSIIRLTSKQILSGIGIEAGYVVRVEGFERLMDFSIKWHDSENTGNKVKKIQAGSSALEDLMRLLYQEGFSIAAQYVGVVGVFLMLDLPFFLFCAGYLFLFFCMQFYFYQRLQKAFYDYNIASEKSGGVYYEGASNVLTVKTLGAKDSISKNVLAREEIVREKRMKLRDISTLKWKCFQVIKALSLIAFLMLVGNQVLAGGLTVGSILIYYTYFTRLTDAAGSSTEVFAKIVEYKTTIARMMPIYWSSSEIREGKQDFPAGWSKFKIVDGHFRYRRGAEDFRIKEINLEIDRYQKIGIAGESGSGKSTLAKLLLGIYELEDGDIFFDQTGFYDLRRSEITKHISIVLQESELFNFSLAENITLMRRVEPELFQKAIEISQLEEVIEKLPEGLDTLIGEKGYRLSGGERQRIGIARAICKNPDILVLDEATSSLDSNTESEIQAALEEQLPDMTMIIIAHRLSTLRNLSRILVFDQGSIVETGSFEDLVADNNSKFYELYSKGLTNGDNGSGSADGL